MRETNCLHLCELGVRGPHENEGLGPGKCSQASSLTDEKGGQNVQRLLSREELADVVVIYL